MRNSRALPLDKIKKIESMAEMGLPDVEIAKRLGLSYNTINRYSTNYWKNKMKNARQV